MTSSCLPVMATICPTCYLSEGTGMNTRAPQVTDPASSGSSSSSDIHAPAPRAHGHCQEPCRLEGAAQTKSGTSAEHAPRSVTHMAQLYSHHATANTQGT
jgi:hypothetical protein